MLKGGECSRGEGVLSDRCAHNDPRGLQPCSRVRCGTARAGVLPQQRGVARLTGGECGAGRCGADAFAVAPPALPGARERHGVRPLDAELCL